MRARAGDEEASMPMEAILASIWIRTPNFNPDEMLDWSADRMYRFITYHNAGRQVDEELGNA